MNNTVDIAKLTESEKLAFMKKMVDKRKAAKARIMQEMKLQKEASKASVANKP